MIKKPFFFSFQFKYNQTLSPTTAVHLTSISSILSDLEYFLFNILNLHQNNKHSLNLKAKKNFELCVRGGDDCVYKIFLRNDN